MANEADKDLWELEHGRPHDDAGKSNSNEPQKDAEEPKPDEAQDNSWDLESGIDRERLYSPNIIPEVPKGQRKNYVLQAAREATHIAETRGRVYMLVRQWNKDNKPQEPALDLAQLIEWALNTWDTPFKRLDS